MVSTRSNYDRGVEKPKSKQHSKSGSNTRIASPRKDRRQPKQKGKK